MGGLRGRVERKSCRGGVGGGDMTLNHWGSSNTHVDH